MRMPTPTRHLDKREKISKSLETFIINVFKAVKAFESVQTNNTCILTKTIAMSYTC